MRSLTRACRSRRGRRLTPQDAAAQARSPRSELPCTDRRTNSPGRGGSSQLWCTATRRKPVRNARSIPPPVPLNKSPCGGTVGWLPGSQNCPKHRGLVDGNFLVAISCSDYECRTSRTRPRAHSSSARSLWFSAFNSLRRSRRAWSCPRRDASEAAARAGPAFPVLRGARLRSSSISRRKGLA